MKALGCSGGSIVTVAVTPVFQPAPSLISPERAKSGVPPGHEVPRQPLLQHTVTGDPFDPQPKLLWVRGDSINEVRSRLVAIAEDPDARRFERTTTVPLIDTLLPLLGVQAGFRLAAQMRAGNFGVNALRPWRGPTASGSRGEPAVALPAGLGPIPRCRGGARPPETGRRPARRGPARPEGG